MTPTQKNAKIYTHSRNRDSLMKPIPFFDENITIDVHTATHAKHIKRMSIKSFTNNSTENVSLYQNGDELYARKQNGDFIEGKEV